MTFRCLLPLATVTPKWIQRASLRNQHSDDDDGDDGDGDGDDCYDDGDGDGDDCYDDGDGDGDGDDRYDDRDGDDRDGDDRDDDRGACMDPACIITQSRRHYHPGAHSCSTNRLNLCVFLSRLLQVPRRGREFTSTDHFVQLKQGPKQ